MAFDHLLQMTVQSRSDACNFIRIETQTHVFCCEFCEIFKTSFFYNNSGGYFCNSNILLQDSKDF